MKKDLDRNEKPITTGSEEEQIVSADCSRKHQDEGNKKKRVDISLLNNQYSILEDLED